MRMNVYSTETMFASLPTVADPGDVETLVLIVLLAVLSTSDLHFLCTIKV